MAKRRNTKKLVSAHEQSVDALFNADSFVLDYYQRGYVWEEPQVARRAGEGRAVDDHLAGGRHRESIDADLLATAGGGDPQSDQPSQ